MDDRSTSPRAVATLLTDADDADLDAAAPLFRDGSFWGLTATQFLGAFNDNVFKQLMLLLAIPVGAAAAQVEDQQWYAMMAFSLPFVLFSGFAGYLSDRYSKRTVIVLAKLAEIGIMLLGMVGFLMFVHTGYRGLLAVLFLMGTHSAFFGPGKYGILPELFRAGDLPRANGIILMTTFLAIIFGTASAGVLGTLLADRGQASEDPTRLWIGSAMCVLIAVLGTCTSLLIRKTPRAEPNLRFHLSSLWVPPETRTVLAADRPLVLALLVSCLFWLIGGVAMSAVNSLGKVQLGLNDAWTSIMTAVIGLGIAVGAVLAGRLCRQTADFRVTRAGACGIIVSMLLLAAWGPGGRQILGFGGSLVALVVLGMSAGMFAIPVQVFIQVRPPQKQRGRMIAVMNLLNFIAIFLAGPVYKLFDVIANSASLPRSSIFAMAALLILPVALFYRPRNEKL
jgi:acyl-[acyl-carrier-protein]-phospholipid O-acyltransferase/long-chain-fatty-acid--[acyl-carrier-protein] ligase